MRPATVGEALSLSAQQHPDRILATYATGEKVTYAEQMRRSAAIAAAFGGRGIGRGDRVVLMLDNEPAFLDVWFACALGGAVMVPLNTKLQGRVLADLMRRVQPHAVVSASEYAGALDEAGTGGARYVTAAPSSPDGWELLPHDGDGPRGVETSPVGPSEPMSIIFTSGTTGGSKGVVLSHAHCLARSESYIDGLQIDDSDVMFTCLPLFHNNAQMASVMVALLAGGSVAIHPRFSVARFWDDISSENATRVTLIGRMANQLLELGPQEIPPHRLKTACIVPPPRGGNAFAERFSVRVVSQYYGCTEMIPMPPDLVQPERPGSCGRPGPGFECDIVDEDGAPLPAGAVGELVARPLRPEAMMSGYFDTPNETGEAIGSPWFHTGDAMRRDGEGYYYLVGRLADFIRHRGENVSAREIETIVEEHPDVAGAAVVGAPDEWGEERIVLYVETRSGSVDPESIAVYCTEVLPAFMRPHEVFLVPALPRNVLGRVEKHLLRKPDTPRGGRR